MPKTDPKKHGFNCASSTKEQHHFYTTYEWIRGRCNRPSQPGYHNYWWRGIKCERKKFDEFIRDMRESYLEHTQKYGIKDTTIDRIDVNWNYCKENCRRLTIKEQWSTRRDVLLVEVDGEIYTSRRLADMIWICHQGANSRLRKYRDGKFTKEQLFYVGKMKKGSFRS